MRGEASLSERALAREASNARTPLPLHAAHASPADGRRRKDTTARLRRRLITSGDDAPRSVGQIDKFSVSHRQKHLSKHYTRVVYDFPVISCEYDRVFQQQVRQLTYPSSRC